MGEYLCPGDFSVDWERRVDWEGIRQTRIENLRRAMRAHGLDAILALRIENVRYITGFRPVMALFTTFVRNAALLPLDGEPVAFITGFDARRARETMPWLKRVINLASLEDPSAARYAAKMLFKPVMEECGLEKANIGIDGALVHFLNALREEVPSANLVSASEAFSEARAIKTPDELKVMRWSSLIADVAMQRALDFIKVGVRECEISGVILKTISDLGAECSHSIVPVVSAGEHSGVPFCRVPTDKVVRSGEFVLMDVGCYFNGYYSDFARTTIVGRPSKEQKEIYWTVKEATEAGLSKIRPGAKNWEVYDATAEVIRRSGLLERGEVDSTAHTPGWLAGHGIGTNIHEPPIVGGREYGETTLQPGMVFSVEPSIHMARVGGVRIEETVVVTETGYEPLTTTPWLEHLFE